MPHLYLSSSYLSYRRPPNSAVIGSSIYVRRQTFNHDQFEQALIQLSELHGDATSLTPWSEDEEPNEFHRRTLAHPVLWCWPVDRRGRPLRWGQSSNTAGTRVLLPAAPGESVRFAQWSSSPLATSPRYREIEGPSWTYDTPGSWNEFYADSQSRTNRMVSAVLSPLIRWFFATEWSRHHVVYPKAARDILLDLNLRPIGDRLIRLWEQTGMPEVIIDPIHGNIRRRFPMNPDRDEFGWDAHTFERLDLSILLSAESYSLDLREWLELDPVPESAAFPPWWSA